MTEIEKCHWSVRIWFSMIRTLQQLNHEYRDFPRLPLRSGLKPTVMFAGAKQIRSEAESTRQDLAKTPGLGDYNVAGNIRVTSLIKPPGF